MSQSLPLLEAVN